MENLPGINRHYYKFVINDFMELVNIREKLHTLIDTTSEDRLLEIYQWLDDDYTDEFKAELDEEFEDYKKNKEVISKEDVDLMIEQLLHKQK